MIHPEAYHLHPSIPPIPSIRTMAAARRPEKAPDKAAAEKKRLIRVCNSCRL